MQTVVLYFFWMLSSKNMAFREKVASHVNSSITQPYHAGTKLSIVVTVTLYNIARLTGPRVSIACVPASLIQPLLVCPSVNTIKQVALYTQPHNNALYGVCTLQRRLTCVQWMQR